MKILLTNFHRDRGGGHDTYILAIAQALSLQHRIFVAAPATSRLFMQAGALPCVTTIVIDFSAKFKKRFGVDILSYAPFGYDGAWVAIKAMQQAKSSSPAVYRPVLKAIDYDGVTGKISFENNGALKSGASSLYQVKNGAWVSIVTRSGS